MDSATRPRYDWEGLAVTLYEGLVSKPEGMTIYEIAELLDVSLPVARQVIRKLRLDLGEGDSINVPIKNDGKERLYFLSGTLDDSQDWLSNRARFKAACIKVDIAALRSLMCSIDGRTKDGRVLRQLSTSVGRLEEDLSAYLEEVKAPV